MKRLTAVFALCLFAAAHCAAQQAPAAPPATTTTTAADTTSAADQPATAADIDRYYEAMHIRELMLVTVKNVSQQMRKMMHDQLNKNGNLPPGAQEKIDKFYDQILAEMPIDGLLDAMRPVYQKHFTKGDIDALVAFYSSPVGKKVLAEMPTISSEAMQSSSGVLTAYMEHAQQQAEEMVAEMLKEAQPDPKKATEKN